MSKAKSIPKSACRSARSASRRRKISTASSSLTSRSASTTRAAHGATRNLPATRAKVSRPLREEWIRGRGDVAEYDGREIKPEDNGYLTRGHEEFASQAERKNRLDHFQGAKRKPLRASAGHPVTQLWYARQGIITPEMEFIAIRENHRTQRQKEEGRRKNRGTPNFLILPSYFILRSGTRSNTPTPAKASAHASRKKSPPNSSAPKSPAAAPSSRPTSTIPSSSR